MKKKYNITSIENPNHIFATGSQSKKQNGSNTPVNFEEAISAAGYGKFNILVLFTMIPTCLATVFSTTAMSYIFPIAHCDLDLSLDNKGMLNSVTYIGMISSGFLFGYLTDAIGRRKLIIYVYIIDVLLIILCGLSQKYIPLLIVKFLDGFIVNGGYAAYIAYVNEFHEAKYRPLVAIFNGLLMNTNTVVLPLLAWLIFSDNINIFLFDDSIKIRSWNIFIIVCGIPSLVAAVTYIFMPESPKFLMAVGRNEEALQVFRKVYSINTGLSPDTYPVRILKDEKQKDKESSIKSTSSCTQLLEDGWHETMRLFYPPYIGKIILVLIINFGFLLGINTLRLWFPQLFIAIYDYNLIESTESFDICSSLERLAFANTTGNSTCNVNYDNSSVYIHIIICGIAATGIILICLGIVTKVSSKKVLVIGGCISGVSCIIIYFAPNIPIVMLWFTLHLGLIHVTSSMLIGVVVNVFPTALRATAIALTMASGRTGSSVGNIIFPILLSTGCIYPFATIGIVVIVASLLTLLLPNTEMTPLQ